MRTQFIVSMYDTHKHTEPRKKVEHFLDQRYGAGNECTSNSIVIERLLSFDDVFTNYSVGIIVYIVSVAFLFV